MNYSKKLKAFKINNDVPEDGIRYGIEIGEEKIVKMLDGFATRDEIINVPTPILFDLFDEYCVDNNLPMINHMTLGRIVRKHFNVGRKKARKGKDLFWVYYPIYDEDRS